MNDAKLESYCRRGHRTVEGWLSPIAIAAIRLLADAQHAAEVRGAVCEIGVHHGRLFILLCLLRRAGERALAYDLFGRQEENVDGSGAGDIARLHTNLERHGVARDDVVVVEVNSLALSPPRIRTDAGGPIRLFSIDGGHTAAATRNDLALAAAVIAPGGLVILDDFFNEAWPGVAEGACAFMAGATGPALAPVAIAGNKFVFTSGADSARRYQEAIMHSILRAEYKRAIAFDRPVVVRLPELSLRRRGAAFAARHLLGTRLNRWLRLD